MNKLLGGVALIGSAIMSTMAASQSAPPPGVSQGTEPMPIPWRHAPPVIRSPFIVRNEQGRVITREAVIARVRAVFAHLDTNRDGYVTRSELASLHERMMMTRMRGKAAPNREPSEGLGRRAPWPSNAAAVFDRIDINHDGVISRDEFMRAHSMMAQRRLTMNDGPGPMSVMAVGGREHSFGRGADVGHNRNFLRHLFEIADANHDGRVSLEEAEAAALRHFDQLDLNHDGRLTADERRQGRPSLRGNGPG